LEVENESRKLKFGATLIFLFPMESFPWMVFIEMSIKKAVPENEANSSNSSQFQRNVTEAGLPDFSWYMIPKPETNVPN
jgi:hypothetical protein